MTTSGFAPVDCCAAVNVLTRSIKSSSTQPPDTEPITCPSSRITSIAPIGRGAEPHVRTTVASVARWPASNQATAVFTTSVSTLSNVNLSIPVHALTIDAWT